jgi:hypothetical protein
MNRKTLWNVSQISFLENNSECKFKFVRGLEKMNILSLGFIKIVFCIFCMKCINNKKGKRLVEKLI